MITIKNLQKVLINVNHKKGVSLILIVAIFADFAPNFLFEFFDKYQANVSRIHQEELNNTKIALNQARAGEESLRKTLVEYYE